MAASAAASVVCLTDKILCCSSFGAALAPTAVLPGAAALFATTFGSGFLDVTEAFFTGAFGVTVGLAGALRTDFAAVLLAATVALEGFFCTGLAIDLPAFETALTGALFAVFLAATALGLEAGLEAGLLAALGVGFAALFAVAFLIIVLAEAFTAGLAAVFAFFADALEDEGLAALVLVAEALTVFLVVAMGSSTKWNCRCCKGNLEVGPGCQRSHLQAGHLPGVSARCGTVHPANSIQQNNRETSLIKARQTARKTTIEKPSIISQGNTVLLMARVDVIKGKPSRNRKSADADQHCLPPSWVVAAISVTAQALASFSISDRS